MSVVNLLVQLLGIRHIYLLLGPFIPYEHITAMELRRVRVVISLNACQLSTIPIMRPYRKSGNFLYGILHFEQGVLTIGERFIANRRRYRNFNEHLLSFIYMCYAECFKMLLDLRMPGNFGILVICIFLPIWHCL